MMFTIHHHHHIDLDSYVLSLLRGMSAKIDRLENRMAAIDDLNNAVTSLAEGFAALDAAVQAEIVALNAALAANNGPAIATAVANISKVTNSMAQDAAALTASVPAATTVAAPAPAPAPAGATATVTPPTIAPVTVTDPTATPPTA